MSFINILRKLLRVVLVLISVTYELWTIVGGMGLSSDIGSNYENLKCE